MANSENLIPAKPGEVRNPNGRGKGNRNRSTIVREALEAILAGTDQQVVDGITAAAIAKAMTGDIAAFKELMDSGYGKNPDKTEFTGDLSLSKKNLTDKILADIPTEKLEEYAVIALEQELDTNQS